MSLRYQLDDGFGEGKRLGLIVLSTDETLENEAREVVAGRGVSLLHARIPAEAEVTPEALATMEGHMSATAALLPAGLNAVGYGCTSGATVIGPGRVAELVRNGGGHEAVTNPLSAVLAALEVLEVRRVGLVTPYVDSVNRPLIAALEVGGVEVVTRATFNQSDDWSVARIAEADTLKSMTEVAGQAECHVIFASCTNLRTFGILEAAEAATGLPVVSSNLALIWHLLRLAGIEARGWGPGRLFEIA